jgi:chitin disaccharide deacetylase
VLYTFAVRRLIINADDLGLTAGVNRGILHAHAQGVVTSTTLMANSRAFRDAVELARAAGLRSVGCHVVLVDGEPVLAPERVPSLVERNGTPAEFRSSLLDFAASAARGRLDPAQIQAEGAAQMSSIQATGIELTHFDTHKHAHIFPPVLQPLLRAARECGVRAVRNPFAPLKPLAFAHLARRPRLWTRYSEVRILRTWGADFRRRVEAAGLATTDGTFGIVVTGALDATLFRAIVGCIPEGTWELVCHPGYCDDDLRSVRTRLKDSRAKELEVLTSSAARAVLDDHGVELISYRDLRL